MRGATYKGVGVWLVREDEDYYYVWTCTRGPQLPPDFFVDTRKVGLDEYRGKIPKDAPELELDDEE